ncbi:MAG: hypothetical protein WCP55_10250, partial [Lentisphaerota bacterium]
MIKDMNSDWRHLENGLEIPTQSYSDQPFMVKTNDDAWLCCVTTGQGHEGAPGQHVSTMRSTDCGKNWNTPVPVEPPGDVENSYAVMLKVPGSAQNHFLTESSGTDSQEGGARPIASIAQRQSLAENKEFGTENNFPHQPSTINLQLSPAGRVYIFYNHNTDNVREVKCHNGKDVFQRVDSLGHFVFKYSDDHGKSGSAKRYDIQFRLFQCDRDNVYGGSLCLFWNVGRPFTHGGSAYVPLIKVGQMGDGFFQQSEGCLLASDNLLSETNPEKIRWQTLPDGDVGLRTPLGGGPISEEQSYVVLSDGSFYVNYRSIDGYPVESYSRDDGHTWSQPQYKRYADGRMIKHPRAANFVWKCENGKYIYWFHNHGGHFIREMWDPAAPTSGRGIARGGHGYPYDDRNPVWISGGIETDSPDGKILKWSEPEIMLYDDDPFIRISYPDLIEQDGRYFISETQKDIARIHEIPTDFLNRIWYGLEMSLDIRPASAKVADDTLLMNVQTAGQVTAPQLPEFFTRDNQSPDYRGKATRQGFALEMVLSLNSIGDAVIIEGRRKDGRGLALSIVREGRLELLMNDGWMEQRMLSEPCLKTGKNHIVINIDSGPRIVSFIVNGRFCDGGEHCQFGW